MELKVIDLSDFNDNPFFYTHQSENEDLNALLDLTKPGEYLITNKNNVSYDYFTIDNEIILQLGFFPDGKTPKPCVITNGCIITNNSADYYSEYGQVIYLDNVILEDISQIGGYYVKVTPYCAFIGHCVVV